MEKYVGGNYTEIDDSGDGGDVNDIMLAESIGNQHETLLDDVSDMGPNTDSSHSSGDVGIFF